MSALAQALGAIPTSPRPLADLQRLDVGDLCRRWRCSRQTVERRQRDGTLPLPLFLLQRRVWNMADVEAAERAMNERHGASLSGASVAASARRAAAQQADARALEEIEKAAAAFLARKSAGDLVRVLSRFVQDGRIASIPREKRPAALRALGGGK
jgi:hypothetical protein